jgi:YfiH family protein
MMAEALTTDSIKVPHGFFTRRGGVSGGGYASLNCSLSGQDDSDKVMENRARAARSLGLDPGRLVGLTQVHGTHVVTVTEPWAPGRGEMADAMVTDRPGVGLGIVTADCAPVLFADASAGVVGATHAGWRGAVAGVLEATISAMIALGSSPERITAAVGPCIAQASYEVGPDLRDAVLAHDAADSAFFTAGEREDRWQFDLPGYCAARLRRADVGHILVTRIDTLAEEDRFFSHRRRTLAERAGPQSAGLKVGPIGHQISVIRLA